MKITIIGAGNMGGALVKGWAKNPKDLDITVSDMNQQTLDSLSKTFPHIHTMADNQKAAADADVIVVAVKPWLVTTVLDGISSVLDGKLLISVAANTRDERINAYVIPNIAAEFGASMSFVECNADKKVQDTVAHLFSLVGDVQVVDRAHVAAGMMLSSCGIAYVMRFLRAMTEGGVEMGFYPKDAQQIAQQTMLGAVRLLEETGLHPEAAIDKVTTPGGVTIKGLNELDHAGFNSAVIRCLKAGL